MNLTEAFEVLFKGAKYGAGTIRTWANGKQYQKQADGKWVEYKVGAKQAIKEGVGKLHMKGEDDIVMLTHERAYIYDKKGNIAHQIDGNEKYIEFTKEQLSLMKGKVCTHNHPSYLKKKGYGREHGNSFSKQDIVSAFSNGLKEIRAVAGDYVYSFKRKDGKNLGDNFDKKDFLMDIFRIDMDVRSELEPLITKEKITIDEANFSHWHKVWEVYTKENPEFEYTKTKAF